MEKEKSLNEIQRNFRNYDQSQLYWDVIHVNKLLEEEHPARILDRIIEGLDLKCLYLEHSNEGNPAYHPRMMLKVLFYGYYTGMISCRKIWDAVKYRADFIYLSAGQVPNYRTINSFRNRHLKNLPDLFMQIVLLCTELDLIGFDYLAIDGETIKANANFQKNKNISSVIREMEELERQIEKVLKKDLEESDSKELEDWQNEKIEKMKKKYEKLKEAEKKLDILVKKNLKNKKKRN
jgi:transposase